MFDPIPLPEFKHRTKIESHACWKERWNTAWNVVSLRQMAHIIDLSVMPMDYLEQLLRCVPLVGDSSAKPFLHARLCTGRLDPRRVRVPQTFIQRDKYQAFIEEFDRVFDGFAVTKGVAKCTALIAQGRTHDGLEAIAHYVPPIIEQGDVLLDGMHRNFLVMRIGTTMEAVFLENVSADFPCTPQHWDKVRIVSEKPPKEERFFDLRPDLFRDLKYVGIDG